MARRKKSSLKWIVAGIVFLALGCGVWLSYQLLTPMRFQQASVEFEVNKGSSLRSAAQQMEQAGILRNAWSFVLAARLLGKAGSIKAGNYAFESGITPLSLLDRLTRGDVTQAEITFIEGWTFRQMRAALSDHPGLRHDTLQMTDREILRAVGAVETSPEGLFFPDTYFFSRGSSDIQVLKRAYGAMRTRLAASWETRAPELPLENPYQALILASIVEKETGQERERPMIAAVFLNRLKIGMRLQTDPSVIYGMGEKFDGNLRKQDLATDSEFNTYTRAGLPPTPIAIPGLASIQAVMQPASTNALYFVARGDGSSHFSETLAEHNRAVTKYQKNPAVNR